MKAKQLREKIALGEREFHMFLWPFDAVKVLSREVKNEHLGPMGAVSENIFIDSDGNTVRESNSMGGVSYYINSESVE